jgi:hypothetical protein
VNYDVKRRASRRRYAVLRPIRGEDQPFNMRCMPSFAMRKSLACKRLDLSHKTTLRYGKNGIALFLILIQVV